VSGEMILTFSSPLFGLLEQGMAESVVGGLCAADLAAGSLVNSSAPR